MFGLPLHPAVVHVPIGVAVIMPLVAILLTFAIWKKWLPRKAWWLVVILQAVVVLGCFAALATGEDAEHKAEKVVSDDLIEQHHDAGVVFTVLAVGTLAVAGAGIAVARKEKLSNLLNAATTVASIGVLAMGAYVGHLGGRLVFVHGAAQAYTGPVTPAPTTSHADDD
jgi:uncharacterized membrane protein